MAEDESVGLEEEEWGMLAEGLKAGEYALFVGSGFSSASGLPTGTQLAEKMIRKLYPNALDPVALFKERFSYDGDILLERITQLIEERQGRKKLLRYLHNCVNWDPAPVSQHKCIELLAMKVQERGNALRIITPNYDCLLENALPIKRDVLVLEEHWERARDACPWVVKVHGCIRTEPQETIRITDADLVRDLEPWKVKAIEVSLSRKGLVVIGYGAYDSHVRRLVEPAIREAPRESYWVSLGRPSQDILQALSRKKGKYISIDSMDFFTRTGILREV